jgi:transposase
MSEEIEIAGIKVPQVDWAATPASIQALVVVLSERLQQQDDRIRHLEERLNQNSKNSSKPPSSDGLVNLKAIRSRSKAANPRKNQSPHPVRSASLSRAKPVTKSKRYCHQCVPIAGHR